jgi:hypothetical protein
MLLTSTGINMATVLTGELLTNVIHHSAKGLKVFYSFISESGESVITKKYHDDLDLLDIPFKLQLITNWLKQNNMEKIKSNNNLEILYNGINESCNIISNTITSINNRIEEHKSKWFHNWRTLYLEDLMDTLKKNTSILNERLKLVNFIN